MNIFVFVILGITLLGLANGACWYTPLKNETTEYGTVRHYCEYEIDGSNETVMKVMIGAKFETLDCEKCQCMADGLHCCGTGFYSGVFGGPSKCQAVPDGCETIFVLKTDNKTNCFTGKPVRPNQYGMWRPGNHIRRVHHRQHVMEPHTPSSNGEQNVISKSSIHLPMGNSVFRSFKKRVVEPTVWQQPQGTIIRTSRRELAQPVMQWPSQLVQKEAIENNEPQLRQVVSPNSIVQPAVSDKQLTEYLLKKLLAM